MVWPALRGLSEARPLSVLDLEDLLEEMERTHDFDSKRIALLGLTHFSATAALQFAVRMPGRFAGVVAHSPFVMGEKRECSGRPLAPAWGEWDSRNSVFALMENLRSVPSLLTLGEMAPSGRPTDLRKFVTRASDLGLPVRLAELPGADFTVAQIETIEQAAEFLSDSFRTNTSAPPSRYTFGELAFGRIGHFSADGIKDPMRLGTITLPSASQPCTPATLGNVRDLALVSPETYARECPNSNLRGAPSAAGPPAHRRKDASLAGPVYDVFRRPFRIVLEHRDAGQRESWLKLAQDFARHWESGYAGRAADLLGPPTDETHIVLLSDGTGPRFRALAETYGMRREGESLTLGSRRFTGKQLLLTAVLPDPMAARGRYTLLVLADSPAGVDSTYFSELPTEGFFDYHVRDLHSRTGIEMGLFDENWSEPIPFGAGARDDHVLPSALRPSAATTF